MAITASLLTRSAGVAAAAAGLIFIGVQINHPPLDVTSVASTEWAVRNSLKVLMAALALVGITGMYLRQVKQSGVLGLLGYLLFGAGYLVIMSVAFVAAYVLPSLAASAPGYVNDVLAVAAGGRATGEIGLMQLAFRAEAIGYLAGGLLFGIALYRARVLARWAAALLAAGTFATVAIPLLPQSFERPLAFPTGIALVGLGYSLWRTARTETTALSAGAQAPRPATAGAR
ncbi:MAG: hypothetical protein QOJ50_2534 [Cryptosporangiaceae bacterium]|jgi:hypothetical protein|nr:hypothetical protein [Cryptosporangiaceae bacterium]